MSNPMEPFNIALYGASGALGAQILLALEGAALPIEHLTAVGGTRGAGGTVTWRRRPLDTIGPGDVNTSAVDIAILAVPAEPAATLRRQLVAAGVFTIDLSQSASDDATVPLLWPGLNDEGLETHDGAIAIPGAVASTLAPILKGAAKLGDVIEVDVVGLLAASAAGYAGEAALSQQTVSLLSGRQPDPGPLGGILAFNLLPGSFQAVDDGDPLEAAVNHQLRRLVPEMVSTRITFTPLRVAVFHGLCLAVRAKVDAEDVDHAALLAAIEEEVTPHVHGPALREAMDAETILMGQPRHDPDGSLRVTLASDPLTRTAAAVARVVARVAGEELW